MNDFNKIILRLSQGLRTLQIRISGLFYILTESTVEYTILNLR